MTVASAAIYVLEGAPTPLAGHDIVRQIKVQIGRSVERPTLNVALSQDRRACWAGQGVYGLYRHGSIGPRKLADVTEAVLLATDDAFHVDELTFVLDHMGYVFNRASLRQAMSRNPLLEWPAPATVRLDPDVYDIDWLGLAGDAETAYDVLSDVQRVVEAAREEYARRSPTSFR